MQLMQHLVKFHILLKLQIFFIIFILLCFECMSQTLLPQRESVLQQNA